MSKLKDNYREFVDSAQNSIRQKKDFAVFESIAEYYEEISKTSSLYYSKYKAAKQRAAFYRYRALKDLPNKLIDFEDKISSNGAKVIYCPSASDAIKEINSILEKKQNHKLFVSNDSIIEEIGLESSLNQKNIKYISSKQIDTKYTILENTFEDLSRKLALEIKADGFSLIDVNIIDLYKKNLINNLYSKSVSIGTADFAISDIASLFISDKTGLNSLKTAFCDTQIIVLGIDRLISSFMDLDLIYSLKSANSVGDFLKWGQTIINGTKKVGEIDGPTELYVLWLDNGRTKILSHTNRRKILSCIDCGICDGLCPVFKFVKKTGNLNSEFSPLSLISKPLIEGEDKFYLPYSCTMCGKCAEVCPMDIPISELILRSRRSIVAKNVDFGISKIQKNILKNMFLKRSNMESKYNKFILKNSNIKNNFGTQKIFPDFSQKSFHMLWKEKMEVGV